MSAIKRLVGACVLVAMGSSLPSCGSEDDDSSSPAQQCREIVNVFCDRVYECLTDAEIALVSLAIGSDLGNNPASCRESLEEENGCNSATADDLCEGSEQYHADEAGACVSQTRAATCSQLRDQSEDYAPACDRICAVE